MDNSPTLLVYFQLWAGKIGHTFYETFHIYIFYRFVILNL